MELVLRWVVLACLAVPTASAVSLEAFLEVRGDASFQGSGDGRFDWSGSVLDARLGHDLQSEPIVVDGKATLYVYSYIDAELEDSSPPGHSHVSRLVDTDEQDLGHVSGQVHFQAGSARSSVRLLPDGPVARSLDGAFALSSPRMIHASLARVPDAHPPELRESYYPPMGGIASMPKEAAVSFAGRLVVTGYSLGTSVGDIDTRWKDEGPTVPGLGHWVSRTTRVLVVEGQIQAQDTAWQQTYQGLDASVEGDLFLENAEGTGRLNGTPLPAGVHLFQAMGRMNITAQYSESPARWTIEGHPRFVAVNAQPVLGERITLAVAAAGLGTLALLAAVAAKWGRALLAAVPGLNIARPFGNQRRTKLLSAIAAHPGLDQVSLAATAGMGRGTARHHLRILLKADILTERLVGRRRTYTLNRGTFDFQLPASKGTAGYAMALARHPQRARLLDALETLGTGDYELLAKQLGQAGVHLRPNAASYHLGLLADAGLVTKHRVGRRILWKLAAPRDAIMEQHRSRFLQGARRALYECLRDEPQSIQELRSGASRKGVRLAAGALMHELETLANTGYATKVGSLYRRA